MENLQEYIDLLKEKEYDRASQLAVGYKKDKIDAAAKIQVKIFLPLQKASYGDITVGTEVISTLTLDSKELNLWEIDTAIRLFRYVSQTSAKDSLIFKSLENIIIEPNLEF